MKEAKRWINKLNQKKAWYPYWCPIFWNVINLAYNTWVILNKEDIDAIIKICSDKKIRFPDKWWYMKPITETVYNYIVKNHPEVSYMIYTKDSPNFDWYYDKWYMQTIWISVNNKFITDKKDNAKIDTIDYKTLAWEWYKHITNMIKWFGWEYEWKTYIFDSYYGNSDNLYQVDKKEMEEDVMQNTVSFFYLK